jgi:uncharacterized protein YndB with AHSA1/START domain
MIKPVTSTIEVPVPRASVFEALAVLADHERFTDHFLIDWSVSGSERGVGAKARMRVKKPGRSDWLDMEVVAAENPSRTVEESVSGGGRRRTVGTYTLTTTGDGGTLISFTLEWLAAPMTERLIAPITRAVTKRANDRSLRRLAEGLVPEGGADLALT